MVMETTPLLKQCIVTVPKSFNDDYDEDDYTATKGLTLEELLPFEDDPWWRHARRICLITFWITLVAIFTAACTLSVLEHGTCPRASVGIGARTNRTTLSGIGINSPNGSNGSFWSARQTLGHQRN